MPHAADAERRPVPYRRAEGAPAAVRPPGRPRPYTEGSGCWTGNWATEHPPAQAAGPAERLAGPRAPAGIGSAKQWLSWAVILLVLAAAGLLFWAPWRARSDAGSSSIGGAAAAASGTGVPAQESGPGVPQGRVVDGPIVPVRIVIPALGVNTAVEHRGTVRAKNAFTGRTVEAYGVPTSMRTTSWWSDGPQPGSGQMAVILGHTQVGGYGVFNKLATLRTGTPFTLRAANGDTLRLQVLGSPVTGLDKSTSALADTLNHHPAGADLAMVTCGGQFDDTVHQSQDNDVVFATVVH